MAARMIKITRRGPFFGERAQIVSFPIRRNGKYGVQVVSSLETFKLDREDFVILSSARTRAR